MQATTGAVEGTIPAEQASTEPCTDLPDTSDARNQQRRVGRPADDAPEESDDDDNGVYVLEYELWQRSLMMAEIIEQGRENDESANDDGVGGGAAQEDDLMDTAVEDMELQKASILSATQDRRRAAENTRESSVADNRWVRGARSAFDRLLSDIRSRGASDQHHVVDSVALDASRSRVSEARAPALRNYDRLLAGILRPPGQATAESARTAPRPPEQDPAENLASTSWHRGNTGSHVDLMAEILARGDRSERTSTNDTGPPATAADDQAGNRRGLLLAEILSRGGQAQPLRRRRSERMERMAQAMRQMGEAVHASLSNELDLESNSVCVEPSVEASVCVICMESPRSYAFIPCGHRCVCRGCVRRMRRISPLQCPICRRNSTDVIKIYL